MDVGTKCFEILESRRDWDSRSDAAHLGLPSVGATGTGSEDGEEEDEDEELETDIPTLLDREHQRLVRLYQDPRRREELEAERLYLQDYIAALDQVAVDSKFDAFQRRLAAVVALLANKESDREKMVRGAFAGFGATATEKVTGTFTSALHSCLREQSVNAGSPATTRSV